MTPRTWRRLWPRACALTPCLALWAVAMTASAHTIPSEASAAGPAPLPRSLTTAACPAQPDALAFEWCDRLAQAEPFCAALEPRVQGHCLACWLANHPVDCSALDAPQAARCRELQREVQRCADGSSNGFATCLRRTLSRTIRFHNPGATP